jgi:indolepyruvate ferredoxin oxidoreductase
MVPVSARAIERAIELNEVSIEQNKAAFNWGRRAAVDMKSVAEVAAPPKAIPVSRRLSESLDELIARRIDFLTDYQNEAWARRFGALVERVRLAEAKLGARSTHSLHDMPLTAAVASGFFKLMSYKDEYEVARLYTQGDFLRQVHEQFEGDIRLKFHLAPPLLSRRNDKGELIKSDYGPWVLSAFKILARLKSLRGTAFDVFGYTAERRMERRLIDDYEATVNELVQLLDSQRLPLAIQIAGLPQGMRGFGHVKERNVESVMREQARLLDQYRAMTAHAPVDLAVAA